MIEANQAIIQLNDKKIPNTNINFKLNWANQNSEGCRNIYVGNLPPEVDYIELYSLFKSKYPSVHHTSIITENGVSKGFGFVYFIDKDDYDKCLKEMDGFIFHNNPLKVKERKKKSEEKNENKNIIKNNYKYNKLFDKTININNNLKINQYKKKNKNQINLKEINNNYFYKINNNFSFNNQNNFNSNQLNLNTIASFYPKRRAEEDFSQESTYSSLGGEQDLSLSNSSTSQKRKFSDNIELLESDDQKALNKKIQESVDKMFERYKYYNKTSESKFLYF